jgi:hypothetical protein
MSANPGSSMGLSWVRVVGRWPACQPSDAHSSLELQLSLCRFTDHEHLGCMKVVKSTSMKSELSRIYCPSPQNDFGIYTSTFSLVSFF